MATTSSGTPPVSAIPGIENQISDLQQQATGYQDKLNSSPTGLGGDAAPTQYDLTNQQELDKIMSSIKNLNDQKLKAQWYPATDTSNQTGEGATNPGIIGSTVDYLSRPLYGVVGAVKHFTGQGTGSLQDDVASNILTDKSTFGDVLKTAGAPWMVSAPLGFALDIGLDPVNWATMGESALIPRIATGFYKGAAAEGAAGAFRGASVAAQSNLLGKAATIGRFTPFVKNTGAFDAVANRALSTGAQYEALTGRTAGDVVQESGVGVGSYRVGLGDIINTVASATPGGQTFLKNFVYDPINWVREARFKDTLQSALGTGVDVKGAVNARLAGKSIEPFMQQATQTVAEKIASEPVISQAIDFGAPGSSVTTKDAELAMSKLAGSGLEQPVVSAAPAIVHSIDDAVSLTKDPTLGLTADPIENATRIANEKNNTAFTLEDVARIVNSGALGDTGVKWFDGMTKSIKDFRSSIDENQNRIAGIGQKVMDGYDRALGIFRVAKVGASPTSWMNAVVGNLLMHHMGTGGISPYYLRRLKQTVSIYMGRPGSAALLDDLLMNADSDAIRQGMLSNKTATAATIGRLDVSGARYNAERIFRAANDAGLIPAGTKAEDLVPGAKAALDELTQIKLQAGTGPVRDLLKSGKEVTRGDLPAGMLSNEAFNSSVTNQMFEHIATRAQEDPSNLVWKALDFTFNKMPSGYESIDQTNKLATILMATKDGYNINELRSLRHIIDISPEDLTKVVIDKNTGASISFDKAMANKVASTGEVRYTLPYGKALELANVMYLNYNAMPAAIRVLRNFPILGSPFASFMYGMALKTGQTLAYNPSSFTKVNFALNEFGGQKTPLEKKALQGPIYSYLNQPGMFRVPFFDDNPIYLNLSNMIPYYSFNMFTPSEQQYNSSALPVQLVNAIHASPLLKDPVGSSLFDYMIQPLILGAGIEPQGQFGQPLYPVDATALEKTGYGVRNLGEAFVPNIAAYAGLATPSSVAGVIPSYRWRQLANAKNGTNEIGISSKESIPSRVARNVLSATGIPVQAPVNTNFNPKAQGK